MLILSISIYLFIIGWILLLLQRINKKHGINWLVSVIAGLLGLIAWGVLGSLKPFTLEFDFATVPFGLPGNFVLGMDTFSRGIGVMGLAYIVYVINSWMNDLDIKGTFTRIKNIFVSASLFIFLVSAQNEFSYVLVLIAADFYELIQRFTQLGHLQKPKQTMTALFLRFSAVLLFLAGWMLSQNTSAAAVHSQDVMFLAMAMHLWSGLIGLSPGQFKNSTMVLGGYEEIPLFLLGQLVYFIRHPFGIVLSPWLQMLSTIATILMVFHLIQWLRKNAYADSIGHFIQFQIIFILLYAQVSTPAGMLAELFVFLVGISILYFRPVNHRHYRWFLIPLLLFFLGLPYLPTAGFWLVEGNTAWSLWTVYMVFLMGFRSRFSSLSGQGKEFERWMLAIYPVGFVPYFLGIAYLAIIKDMPVMGGPFSYNLVAAGVFLLFALYEFLRYKKILKFDETTQWVATLFDALWRRVIRVFQPDWIIAVTRFISNIIERVLLFINRILEGDGGLLWAIVLLILFLSLVRTAGS